PADRPAELGRSGGLLPTPEWRSGGLALGARDDDAVRLDRLDPPGRRPQDEGIPDALLVDELLVELAESRAVLAEVDRVLPGVGDGAAAGHGEAGAARERMQAIVNPVRANARTEVAKGLGREPARD